MFSRYKKNLRGIATGAQASPLPEEEEKVRGEGFEPSEA